MLILYSWQIVLYCATLPLILWQRKLRFKVQSLSSHLVTRVERRSLNTLFYGPMSISDGEGVHHFKDILKKTEFSVSITAVRKEGKGHAN